MNELTFKFRRRLLALLVLSLVLLWLWPPGSSSEVAAWAQAVTTGAAVFAALFIGVWQHEAQRARDELSRRQLRANQTETAFQLASYVQSVCNKVIGYVSDKTFDPPDPLFLMNAAGELDAIGVAFQNYHPDDFGTYAQLQPLVGVMAARSALARQLEWALAKAYKDNVAGAVSVGFQGAIESIDANVAKLRLAADAATAEVKTEITERRSWPGRRDR